MVDLRVAAALAASGRKADSRSLLDWISGQAAENFLLLPELLTQPTEARPSAYEGAMPMAGFGAGAWVLAMHEYWK